MKGRIVSFVDSDDYVAPNMLELTVPHMEKYDYVQFNVYDVKNGHLSSWDLPSEGPTELNYDTISGVRPSVWNKLYNAEILKRYHLLFPEGLNNEDCMFSYAYRSLLKEGYFINERLYYYVDHDKSITSNIRKNPSKKNLDQIKILQPLAEFLYANDRMGDNAYLFLTMLIDYTWHVFHTMPFKQKQLAITTAISISRQADLIEVVKLAGKQYGWRKLSQRAFNKVLKKI